MNQFAKLAGTAGVEAILMTVIAGLDTLQRLHEEQSPAYVIDGFREIEEPGPLSLRPLLSDT